MARSISRLMLPLAVVAVLVPPVVGESAAQSPRLAEDARSGQAPVPSHKHYDDSKAPEAQAGPGCQLAPRLQKLGVHTFKVTTRSARAQQFINQGLNLTYGFNHAEAGRAFAEAARLDPTCAMALLGPGARARAQHQRGDGARTTSPKALALVQKAVAAQGPRHAPRARVHRCAGERATPGRPRTGAGRSRVRGGDAQDGPRLSRRPRRRARCSPNR